jgi:hypothetical protein
MFQHHAQKLVAGGIATYHQTTAMFTNICIVLLPIAGLRPHQEVDVLSVESWDQPGMRRHNMQSRWQKLVNYTYNPDEPDTLSTTSMNNTYIGVDSLPYYSPGWAFWAMPFGCMDVLDAQGAGAGRLQPTRTLSDGCEGFYVSDNGTAINREYMVPAYNMSDYYQLFPVWGDGGNVAGYRRDKVSPVSFLPSARLGHYRNWTYEPPDFMFKAGATQQRLVIIFHWDLSPRMGGKDATVGDRKDRQVWPCCQKSYVERSYD